MRLMVEFHARQLFFAVFFLKEIKRQARVKNDTRFILFILLVAQLLLRTDAIPYRPIFIYKRLYVDYISHLRLMSPILLRQ